MKKFFLPLILSAFTLIGCIPEGSENYTPIIRASLLTNQLGDTLSFTLTKDGQYLDTLTVGDTVKFDVSNYSFANAITHINATWDSTYVQLTSPGIVALFDSIKSDLATSSDLEHLRVDFKQNAMYNWVSFPIQMVALKSNLDEKGKEAKSLEISFNLESNAQGVPNTSQATFKVLIAEPDTTQLDSIQ